VDDVLVALARYPEALAVIYTSPTYEGLAAHTQQIAEAVHATSEHAIVFVDEAWGGHLHFHPDLPMSAMDAGADVCVQSSHKLAGGLQQTGLIHWREGRVDSELMEEAYREYVTTSPSYHLLASADAAVRSLAAEGEEVLGRSIARTRELRARISERLPEVEHLEEWCGEWGTHVAACDLVKTTLGLSRYDISGFAVAEALVDRHIVIEKAGINTITLITTFQLADEAVEETVAALAEILQGRELPHAARKPMTANPFSALDDRPVMHPYAARRYAKSIGHEVPLAEAVGKVSAELIEVYPPGIPVILEGFRVSADAVEYLRDTRDRGGTIIARDPSLRTLRVL
jgi:arginine decarboxylase